MKRVVVGALGLGLLVVAVLVPAWWYDAGGPEEVYEPTTISSYAASFDVADDGSMRVVETVVVRVSTLDRHGIFRYFDTADPQAPQLRRVPRDVSVRHDGAPVPVEELNQGSGRYVVLRIGDPDRTLSPGEHTYKITYAMDDVLVADNDGQGSRFYWDLVPGGWTQQMEQVRLTVRLPAVADDVQCAAGAGATTTGCRRVSGEGTTSLGVALAGLPARTPVTVSADVALPVPPTVGDTYRWRPALDPVLAPVPWIVLVVLAGLAAGALGAWATRRSHEPTPRFPLQYAPPPGIGPAQAAYVWGERVGREQFVATVLHAAERGVVSLDRDDRSWTVRESGATPWEAVDPVTAGLAGLVGRRSNGFTARSDDVAAGKRLARQLEEFESGTRQWARRAGLVVTGPLGGAGGVVVLAVYGAAIALALWNPLDFSLVAMVPGLFAVGAVGLLMPGSATVRTAAGRDLWSRVGGFRRVLATPASKERFEFSGREELYTAYVPWAVALGCADAWAAKFRTETGREPPVPAYFGAGYAGDHTGAYVDRMVGDFSSTLSSAISSYEATQRSSSAGGGGFSGGGGGGGGGGGSW